MRWMIVCVMCVLHLMVGESRAETDLFPDKVTVTHAKGFTVSYHGHYKVVRILKPWRDATETFEYVLVQRGHPVPEGYAKHQIFTVPVKGFVTLSTSMLPYVDVLKLHDEQTKWVTVKDCEVIDPISKITGGRRYSYDMQGQLHLVQDCYARNGRHDYVVGTYRSSGTVFLNCLSAAINASNEPHHRYSTGILYDNVQHLNPKTSLVLGLWNRLNYGSGHGWAAANSVLWNCSAPTAGITCEKPPLAQNYAIGCNSASMSSAMRWGPSPGLSTVFNPGNAHWEHWNAGPVTPQSLYLAQLQDRQTPATPALPPERVDFNTDGKVDFGDFILFATGFSNADLTYDLTDDAKVDFSDFIEFARAFQAAN